MKRRLRKNKRTLPDEEAEDLLKLNDRTAAYIERIVASIKSKDKDILRYAQPEGTEISRQMKECRRRHMERIETEHPHPMISLVYMDMLNRYRHMKDLAFNIAEVVGGEK